MTERATLQAIWSVVAAIPPGQVATYGDVARLAGMPGRARRIGGAIAMAPPAMNLPWHRVVAAGGRIALPAGSAGYRSQIRKLKAEGLTVENGHVDLEERTWTPDLDELLWGPPAGPQAGPQAGPPAGPQADPAATVPRRSRTRRPAK